MEGGGDHCLVLGDLVGSGVDVPDDLRGRADTRGRGKVFHLLVGVHGLGSEAPCVRGCLQELGADAAVVERGIESDVLVHRGHEGSGDRLADEELVCVARQAHDYVLG